VQNSSLAFKYVV